MASINDKELDEAVKAAEAERSIDTYVHEFDEPVEWEGKIFDTLTFDFGKLTGADFVKIEAEMSAEGKVAISPEFSTDFLLKMAVRACKENIDDAFLMHLPLNTFSKIRNKGRSFLLRSGQ